jgi:hypothetical protein
MKETRGQFKLRLKAEGRWNEAIDRVTQLKKEGFAPVAAWAILQREETRPEAAPVAGVPVQGEPLRADIKVRRSGRERPDPKDDMLWVYDKLGSSRPGDAPSAGARELLVWANAHKQEFMQLVMQRLVTPKVSGERPEDEGSRVQDRQFLGLVDEWLEKQAGPVKGGVEGALPAGTEVAQGKPALPA